MSKRTGVVAAIVFVALAGGGAYLYQQRQAATAGARHNATIDVGQLLGAVLNTVVAAVPRVNGTGAAGAANASDTANSLLSGLAGGLVAAPAAASGGR